MVKRVLEPRTYLFWRGELMEVIGIADEKTIIMREPNAKACERCGNIAEVVAVESSPHFQENAEPVKTLKIK